MTSELVQDNTRDGEPFRTALVAAFGGSVGAVIEHVQMVDAPGDHQATFELTCDIDVRTIAELDPIPTERALDKPIRAFVRHVVGLVL